MSDLIFLHCHHFPRCTARVDKRFEGYHSLQWMEAGALELFYDEERHDLRCANGNCFFWPASPGPRIRFHAAREVHEWNHRYAAFTGPRVESWKRAGLWPQKPQKMPDASKHRAQFDALLHHARRGGAWGTRRGVHALEELLLELAEARSLSQNEPLWLETARAFLEENRDFAPDYARLARELGMGLSTLRRNFKKATGLSLHEARLQNRLDHARHLLGETDAPLKEIAWQLGYANAQFFSTQFKTLSGVSPAAYRRSRQK